jgi:hypothetical protein
MQIIADHITMNTNTAGGNADINLPYDSSKLASPPRSTCSSEGGPRTRFASGGREQIGRRARPDCGIRRECSAGRPADPASRGGVAFPD